MRKALLAAAAFLLPFTAVALPPSPSIPVPSVSVTANGVTNSLAIWTGYLSGTLNPNALALSSATVTGSLGLKGSGTSGSYDSSIYALNGGSIAGQGDLIAQGSLVHLYGWDGSDQFRTSTTHGATEVWKATGGITGHGPLLITESDSASNVSGSIFAKGTGDLYFGNQYGTLFHVYNPGASVQNNLMVTGGSVPSWGGNIGALLFIEAEGVDSALSVGIVPKNQGAFMLRKPDNTTAAGGTNPGQQAVDLGLCRGSKYDVASGYSSALVGGCSNSVTNSYGFVGAGYGNVISGGFSASVGGSNGTDNGEDAKQVFSSGYFFGKGDGQYALSVLRGFTAAASPIRLVAKNNADMPAANATNCLNLLNYETRAVAITLTGRTHSVAGNWYAWHMPMAVLSKDSGASTMTVTLGTPTILSAGTGSTITVSATADTTLGCLNLTVTPPSGNTTQWDFAARVMATEVR